MKRIALGRWMWFVWLMVFAAGVYAQSWSAPQSWERVQPIEHKNIVYLRASGQDEVLDVYQSTSAKPAPVLVYFHGGAWWKGQRPASFAGFRGWLAAGFSVVSVEYRLSGVATAPAAVQDARCSLAWVRRNAARYHFDRKRIVVYGTSAGGHLALMAAMLPARNKIDLPQCKPVPRVAAVLDFYGPTDLTMQAVKPWTSPSVARWLGNVPDPAAYARTMSPIAYVHAGSPPVFLVHGEADPVIPFAQSVELRDALEKAGVKAVLDPVPNGGHGRFPAEQQQRVVLDSLRFLQSLGVLPEEQ